VCEATYIEDCRPPARRSHGLGIAYNVKPTSTVLRLSYARDAWKTPFQHENLVIRDDRLQTWT